MEHWMLRTAAATFAELKNSELAEHAEPIAALHREGIEIAEQIALLEARRQEAEETGKRLIDAYNIAHYQLFLKKVRAGGKEYCTEENQVVSETTPQLVWDTGTYYILTVCPKCLKEMRRTSQARDRVLYDMKEENGTRLFLTKKTGKWEPLPENLWDYTAQNACAYVPRELSKKYGLPVRFGIAQFN